jgi:hypothetical protein
MSTPESKTEPQANFVGWVKSHLSIVIGAAIAVVLLIIFLVFMSWKNGIHNEGFEKQRDVVTLYNNYQTALSTCLDQTNISSQVAAENLEQVKNALTAIVGARYSDEKGALSSDGPIVSALVEQYPEIDSSLWQQLMTTAVGCRAQVAGANGQLQHVAAKFDTWTHQGSWYAKAFRNNWPNDELKVVTLNGGVTGREALDFIVTPLTTGEAKNALLAHEMPNQDLFPDSGTSSTPTE